MEDFIMGLARLLVYFGGAILLLVGCIYGIVKLVDLTMRTSKLARLFYAFFCWTEYHKEQYNEHPSNDMISVHYLNTIKYADIMAKAQIITEHLSARQQREYNAGQYTIAKKCPACLGKPGGCDRCNGLGAIVVSQDEVVNACGMVYAFNRNDDALRKQISLTCACPDTGSCLKCQDIYTCTTQHAERARNLTENLKGLINE